MPDIEANIVYQELPKEFKGRKDQRGFFFTQIWREGEFAVYRKEKGHLIYFEAIYIKKQKSYVIAGVEVPAKEVYPNSEAFGLLAFACDTKEDAFKAAEFLKTNLKKEEKDSDE